MSSTKTFTSHPAGLSHMHALLKNTMLTVLFVVLLWSCSSEESDSSPYVSDGAEQSLPMLAVPYVDSAFGGSVTRLSDSQSGPTVGGNYITKSFYSRVQVENADASRLMVLAANNQGLLQYALLSPDGGTPSFIDFPANNASGLSNLHDQTEARWHPTDPNLIRFIQGHNSYVGSLKVFEYNLSNQQVTVLADLSDKLPARWGQELYGLTAFEGTFSQDGNRLAWIVETGLNRAETPVGYVAFDVRNGGEVLGTLDYDGRRHDHLSISPSGEYVVISAREYTTVHPVDFSSERVIHRETQHSDLCINAAGHDCYVAVSFDDSSNPYVGWVFMHDLVTGQSTPLFNVFGTGNTSLHLSGRALSKPGWALMSTYNCKSQRNSAKCYRLSLVELAANPRIIDLARTHSSARVSYYAEPHASLSRDGLRAYFNSDWHGRDGVNLYRVEVSPENYP